MDESAVRQIVEDHGRVWDFDAPEDLADRLYAPDIVDHNPFPGHGPGIDGMKQVLGLFHAVFPDLRVSNEDVIVGGDRGVLRWSATGTHEGDQLGFPATQRQAHLTGIEIVRVADGRIVERWGESNGLELMQQLQGGG